MLITDKDKLITADEAAYISELIHTKWAAPIREITERRFNKEILEAATSGLYMVICRFHPRYADELQEVLKSFKNAGFILEINSSKKDWVEVIFDWSANKTVYAKDIEKYLAQQLDEKS